MQVLFPRYSVFLLNALYCFSPLQFFFPSCQRTSPVTFVKIR